MTTAKIYQFPVSTLREVATELVALHRASLVRQLTWREQARYVRLMRQRNRLAAWPGARCYTAQRC